jgi:organic radical activating enzyme
MNSQNIGKNAFANPQLYRNLFLNSGLVEGDRTSLSGKAFICVSLTRFCPVGCKFCFFKSGKLFRQPTREDILTEEGTEKFIKFANTVNLGYLLVSGGGEPMMEKQSILKIIRDVESERIVLVTSAYWAQKYDSAERYLSDIKKALSQRQTPTTLTVRVSVDLEHSVPLTLSPIKNLIELFNNEYKSVPQLDLQIHSMWEDPTIANLLADLEGKYEITRRGVDQQRISDGISAIKIVPKQEIIAFDGMEIKVSYASMFYSDLRVNLKDHKTIEKNVEVYQKDLFNSEDGNSSIVTNKLGNPGLDFWINYNGNVTTWGNQYLDNLFNLYVNTPEEIVNGSLNDPAALSFIEMGANYRDRVVSEANPTAVIRSKAVNIRDYTGALMFDEARTRLYYTIRVLQDYMAKGRVDKEVYKTLPLELKNLLEMDKNDLMTSFDNSDYTIVEQVMEKEFDRYYVLDILEWIKRGHYKVSDTHINKLLAYYNQHVDQAERISDIEAPLLHSLKMQIVRMTDHLTHIKPAAAQKELKKAA